MENAAVLNQMKQYDFDSSINVTMIFEISDEENDVDVCDKNEQHFQTNRRQEKDNIMLSKKYINRYKSKNRTKPIEVLKESSKKFESNKNQINPFPEQDDKSDRNNKSDESDKAYQKYNKIGLNSFDHAELYVKDALNTLSEHIIVIMQSYYQYRKIMEKNDDPFCERQSMNSFNKIKYHFFHLSYSTIVTIILPQEQNKKFIDCFLKHTVKKANSISFKWKCERCHVEPFFTDLVTWGKLKKKYLSTFPVQRNENIILKQLLEKNQHLPQQSIFSSETSKETRITKTPETCYNNVVQTPRQHKSNSGNIFFEKQCNSFTNIRRHEVCGSIVNHQPHLAFSNVLGSECTNSSSQYSWPVYQTPVPPAYSEPTTSNVNTTHNNNMHSEEDNACEMYEMQSEQPTTFCPLIISVQSLNPEVCQRTGKCCVCGKTTVLKCSKCNNYSYCSSLCQELDAGTNQRTSCT